MFSEEDFKKKKKPKMSIGEMTDYSEGMWMIGVENRSAKGFSKRKGMNHSVYVYMSSFYNLWKIHICI